MLLSWGEIPWWKHRSYEDTYRLRILLWVTATLGWRDTCRLFLELRTLPGGTAARVLSTRVGVARLKRHLSSINLKLRILPWGTAARVSTRVGVVRLKRNLSSKFGTKNVTLRNCIACSLHKGVGAARFRLKRHLSSLFGTKNVTWRNCSVCSIPNRWNGKGDEDTYRLNLEQRMLPGGTAVRALSTRVGVARLKRHLSSKFETMNVTWRNCNGCSLHKGWGCKDPTGNLCLLFQGQNLFKTASLDWILMYRYRH